MSDLYLLNTDGQNAMVDNPIQALKDLGVLRQVPGPAYTRQMVQKAKCWHTGTNRSHDEGCFEYRYTKIGGDTDA